MLGEHYHPVGCCGKETLSEGLNKEQVCSVFKQSLQEKPALRAWIAMRLYQERSVSLGQAADLADLTKEQFKTLLKPVCSCGECAAVRELAAVYGDKWARKLVASLPAEVLHVLVRLAERDVLIPRELSFENSLAGILDMLWRLGLARKTNHNGLLRYYIDNQDKD